MSRPYSYQFYLSPAIFPFAVPVPCEVNLDSDIPSKRMDAENAPKRMDKKRIILKKTIAFIYIINYYILFSKYKDIPIINYTFSHLHP
jgi:hypothetical protein